MMMLTLMLMLMMMVMMIMIMIIMIINSCKRYFLICRPRLHSGNYFC